MISNPPPPTNREHIPAGQNANSNNMNNSNTSENMNNEDDNDDAQSDISIPYSSLTESTTSLSTSSFLTPTVSSSDADTVEGGGDLHTINSVLQPDEQIDESLAQWRSLYRDQIERQIIENRNRDRDENGTTTTASNILSLSAGNLRLHTSQMGTSTNMTGEGGGEGRGGARLNGSLPSRSLSPSTTISTPSASQAHEADGDTDHEFPPLIILTPAPTDIASVTRSSTPTPAASNYESAPSSPSGGTQKSRPPPSRYTRHAAPLPGQTFILLEASTGRALTLIDGNLRLVHVPDPDLISITDNSNSNSNSNTSSSDISVPPCVAKGQCNWHWHCVETAGWLGFRNAASGTFLGHDMWQNIIARVYKHNGWEWIAVRPAPGGPEGKGWYLMVTHWERLYKIKFLEQQGGALVAMDSVDGTVWEFVGV